jgi:hypothetical protein
MFFNSYNRAFLFFGKGFKILRGTEWRKGEEKSHAQFCDENLDLP